MLQELIRIFPFTIASMITMIIIVTTYFIRDEIKRRKKLKKLKK